MKDLGLACCTADVRRCSSKIFGVVRLENEPLFSDLLASCNFISEHSRQDTDHLSAVLAQKPIWTCGLEHCSWVGLTKPPDEPMVEVVDEDIVFGSNEYTVQWSYLSNLTLQAGLLSFMDPFITIQGVL